MARCGWVNEADPVYVAYHDHEWGKPVRDDRALWELFCLEAFQAGLSWITILRQRENFRAAFAQFDPRAVATFTEQDVERLMQDGGIIRARAKILATIAAARIWCAMMDRGERFSDLVWSVVDGKSIKNHWTTLSQVPVATPESTRLSKLLKARGFKFCGPVICYAFMQAAGLVDDHIADCPCA